MTPTAVLLACAVGIADWGPVRLDAEGVPLPPGVVARLGSSRFRSPGDLIDLRFTPDARQLVGATARAVCVWDARTGHRIAIHTGFRRISHLAVRPDGSLALIAAYGLELRYVRLDRETGRVLDSRKLNDDHDDLALSADGTRIAQRFGGLAKVIEIDSGKTVGDLRFSISDISPNYFAFSPDGKLLAAVFSHNWTEVREVATGNMPYSGTAGDADSCVQEIAFAADSRSLLRLLFAEDKPYRLESIDLQTEKATPLYSFENTDRSRGGVVPSRDGKSVYLAAQNEVARFELVAKTPAITHAIPYPTIVNRGVLSPDGKILAVALSTSGISLYDARTLAKLPQSSDDIVTRSERGKFVADGRRFAILGVNSFQILDSSTGTIVGRHGEPGEALVEVHPDGSQFARTTPKGVEVRKIGHEKARLRFEWDGDGSASRVFFSRDGSRFMTDGDSGYRVWDLPSGKPLAAVSNHLNRWYPSPDGSWAVSIRRLNSFDYNEEYTFHTVDPRTGITLHGGSGNDRCFGIPIVHPFSRTALLSATSRVIGLFDFTESRYTWQRPLSRSSLESANFSSDGRSIAIRQRRAMQLLEAATGKLRYTIPSVESQRPLAFTPDGKHLAAIGSTAPIYLWDVRGSLKNYPAKLDRPTTESLWKDLCADDAETAFLALQRLAAAPATTLPYVRAAVRPAVAPDKEKVAAWIAALDAPAFRDREAAMKELKTVADTIAVELRAARDATPSPEVHERLSKILATSYPETPASVRRTRIVELVEWCGTPDAKRLLADWSAGAKGSLLAAEAKAAVARLR